MDIKWRLWLIESVYCNDDEISIRQKMLEHNFSDDIIENEIGKAKRFDIAIDYRTLDDTETKIFCNILKNRLHINKMFKTDRIVKIDNFFDNDVAEHLYTIMSNSSNWFNHNTPVENSPLNFSYNINTVMNDYFRGYFRIISQLFPYHMVFDMAVAKYSKSDGIDPHTDVQGYIHNGVKYCRDIAIIIYFNKDWKEGDGGLLHDLEKDEYHLPIFNRAILFKVPYTHAVTKVTDPNKHRYSVFGWFSAKYDNQYYLPENRFISKYNTI